MSLIPNTLNFAKNTSIWKELENNLANLFRSKIEIIFPDDWNEKFYEWYQEVEEIAFRKNLRYSFEEVRERLTNDDILFLFILSNNHPEAFILGYSCKIDFKRLFFVDTIAVKKRGQGIGTVLLNYLGKWLQKECYSGMKVYTEEIDEKNFRLRHFYEKMGFSLDKKESNGNLTMFLWF